MVLAVVLHDRDRGREPLDHTWVAGYSNDVMAYIPSLRVLKEGGYEGGEAAFGSGQLAPWGATVEEIVIEKVNDVVLETERKIP